MGSQRSTRLPLLSVAVLVTLLPAFASDAQGHVHRRGRHLLSNHDSKTHQIQPPTLQEAFADLESVYAACPLPQTPLIVAMAAKTKASKVCPFVSSVQLHMPNARVVVFTDDIDMHRAMMGSVHSAPNVHIVIVATQPSEGTEWHFWRYFLYRHFLELCSQMSGGELPPVMLTDSRDTLAQSDVFAHPAMQKAVSDRVVIYGMEGNVGPDGSPLPLPLDSPWAGHWMMNGIRTCFRSVMSDQEWESFSSGPYYSCSGVTMGHGNAVLSYTQAMTSVMMHNMTPECWAFHGGDQPVHAFLHYVKTSTSEDKEAKAEKWGLKQYSFNIMPVANGEAPVYTSSAGQPIHIDMFGSITVPRANWSLRPAFVHQYDRDEDVRKEVVLLYPCALTPTTVVGTAAKHIVRIKFGHLVIWIITIFSVAVMGTAVVLQGFITPWLKRLQPGRSVVGGAIQQRH